MDYRSLSAFYMFLRLLFALVGVAILLNMFTRNHWSVLGLLHVILGAQFLMIKLYPDGLILFLLGALIMTVPLAPKFTFIIAVVIATLVI